MTTRGIRNNNPGNIDQTHPRTNWVGRVPDSALTDPRFEQFVDASSGLRAIGTILLHYQHVDKLMSIREMINRWAPRQENDTLSYIKAVAKGVGVLSVDDSYELVTPASLVPLIKAIVHQENGVQPYSDSQITSAAYLCFGWPVPGGLQAGSTPPPIPASSSFAQEPVSKPAPVVPQSIGSSHSEIEPPPPSEADYWNNKYNPTVP